MISDIRNWGGGFLRAAVLTAVSLPVFAGESAILANGFRIHADRHEAAGDMVRLFAGDGVTEIPASMITSFEQDDFVAPKPAPATPVAEEKPAAPAPPPADPHQPLDPKRLADEAARHSNVPEASVQSVGLLIRSIMHAESGFNPQALSPKGAIGLMQLMPATAQELHADPHDPRQNVEAGAAYLRALLLKYEKYDDQVTRAVAAYNAGPAAVDRYNGVPPYAETRGYVIRVLTEYLKSLSKSGD